MKLIAYHTSRNLFFEFNENLWDKYGDWSDFIEELFNNKALYFSERPIPYYPNNFVYKVELTINNPYFFEDDYSHSKRSIKKCDGLIYPKDKFSNGAKFGEIVVPCSNQVKILAISCNKYFSKYVLMHKWNETKGEYDNDWYNIFKKEFERDCVIID